MPATAAQAGRRMGRSAARFKVQCRATVSAPIARNLLLTQEVIVRRIRYPFGLADARLGATGCGRYTSCGVYALYARDLAERALRTHGLRSEQQPGYRVRPRCIGAFLDSTHDLAAVGRFPMRTGIVLADLLAAGVEQIGLGRDKCPFVGAGLILL